MGLLVPRSTRVTPGAPGASKEMQEGFLSVGPWKLRILSFLMLLSATLSLLGAPVLTVPLQMAIRIAVFLVSSLRFLSVPGVLANLRKITRARERLLWSRKLRDRFLQR